MIVVKYELSANGRNESQSPKCHPRFFGIPKKDIPANENIGKKNPCAEKIAENRISDSRYFLPYVFPDKKIKGNHSGCYEG